MCGSMRTIRLNHAALEAEQRCQFNFSVGCGAREWPTRQSGRLSEAGGGQDSDGRRLIHPVQSVSGVDAERQVIASSGWHAKAKRITATARASESTSTSSTAWTTASAPATTAAGLGAAFAADLGPETEAFRESQVKSEQVRAGQIIDGNRSVGTVRNCVVADLSRRQATPRNIAGECGAIIEKRIVAQVLTRGDIVGRAGIENHERTQTKTTRQPDRASHENFIPDGKGRSSVVHLQIVLV